MVKTDCGISLGEFIITGLDFADDVLIFVEILGAFGHALDTQSRETKFIGLRVFWTRTKIQKFVAFFDGKKYLLLPVQGGHVSFVCLLTAFCTLRVLLAARDDLFENQIPLTPMF